jgi:hypothetical protein
MKKLLLVLTSALTILSAIGCSSATNRYYDTVLRTKTRDWQRGDTVQRDFRLIPYDFDAIFGTDYSGPYNDYPRPNY